MAGVLTYLPVAVRTFTERADTSEVPEDPETEVEVKATKDGPPWLPEAILVLDCETTVDETQRLNFGAWRFVRASWPACGEPDLSRVEEGIFYAGDLPDRDPRGYRALQTYALKRRPEVDRDQSDAAWRLRFVSAREFTDTVLYPVAYRGRFWIVGFNLQFDLCRLATKVSSSVDYLAGGFSLTLIDYEKNGVVGENRWRPRLAIKSLDSKRQLIGFKRRAELDEVDQIPDDGGPVDDSYAPRGNFLDARTLTFALTNRSYSLKRACEDWDTTPKKQGTEAHGRITPRYIDYCRNDVAATTSLFGRLMREYRTHPIELSATKAYSPATVGKAYLKAMGVRPILERQPRFDRAVLGRSMVAYYGGRTECRIRRTPVPVVYVDFLSMYPTVCSLMRLWRLVCAHTIRTVDATDEVRAMLETSTLERWFDPQAWTGIAGLVQLAPAGDILPVRAMYRPTPESSPGVDGNGRRRPESMNWGIGLNPLHSEQPLWYAIPDAIAAGLLGTRPVEVLQAVRFEADGVDPLLRPMMLPGGVLVDPRNPEHDFFRMVIEERKKLARNENLSTTERARLDPFYKLLANSTTYGIYTEMNRTIPSRREGRAIRVYGLERAFIDADPVAIEQPGAFCFPPLAANITAAARLMLALLERKVTDAGGSYAFVDTDSMAIVATKTGGAVACAGGEHRTPSGEDAVRALAWREVDHISEDFAGLNPYDQDAVSGSVLEIEKENFTATGRQRQLHCYAISSKRYALYTLDSRGNPQLRDTTQQRMGEKWSEHGLGHLLNPIDPHKPDRDWIRQFWEDELRRVYGHKPRAREWEGARAIGSIGVTKPPTLRAFAALNEGKAYPESVKPFNFLITAHTALSERPHARGAFQLVAPYTDNPDQWPDSKWVNKNASDGRIYQTVTGPIEDPETQIKIKAVADVLADYRVHPEPKSLAPDGSRSGWHTHGLLRRRPVKATRLVLIGKEATEHDETRAGLTLSPGDDTSRYQRANADWRSHIRPVIKHMSLAVLERRSELKRTALKAAREGRSTPHPRNQDQLLAIAADWAAEQLEQWGTVPPPLALDRCAAYLQERPNQVATKSCPVDGKPVKNPRATYCSDRCKQQAHRDRQRSRKERRWARVCGADR
jgi:predicted nucleic acid-binding Zn ribbon protein